jgi:MFS family permease
MPNGPGHSPWSGVNAASRVAVIRPTASPASSRPAAVSSAAACMRLYVVVISHCCGMSRRKVLDVTVVNVALPDIGVALHLQRGELPWVMTIYTVFFGGLMLLGGRRR